jgi:hypothetical protein
VVIKKKSVNRGNNNFNRNLLMASIIFILMFVVVFNFEDLKLRMSPEYNMNGYDQFGDMRGMGEPLTPFGLCENSGDEFIETEIIKIDGKKEKVICSGYTYLNFPSGKKGVGNKKCCMFESGRSCKYRNNPNVLEMCVLDFTKCYYDKDGEKWTHCEEPTTCNEKVVTSRCNYYPKSVKKKDCKLINSNGDVIFNCFDKSNPPNGLDDECAQEYDDHCGNEDEEEISDRGECLTFNKKCDGGGTCCETHTDLYSGKRRDMVCSESYGRCGYLEQCEIEKEYGKIYYLPTSNKEICNKGYECRKCTSKKDDRSCLEARKGKVLVKDPEAHKDELVDDEIILGLCFLKESGNGEENNEEENDEEENLEEGYECTDEFDCEFLGRTAYCLNGNCVLPA